MNNNDFFPVTVFASCAVCGEMEEFTLNEQESNNYVLYQEGLTNKFIQDLFPSVPAWIRSGGIDKKAGGFCICPKCCGM